MSDIKKILLQTGQARCYGLMSGSHSHHSALTSNCLVQVQAHGGGMLQVNGTFYWCGESYKQPLMGDFMSAGINLYSSTDLQAWKFEGMLFNASQITDMPVSSPYRVERPKASFL